MDVFTKQPSETIDYVIDFTDALDSSDALAPSPSPVVTLALVSGTGVVPTLGVVSINTATNCVKQRVSGGESGQTLLLSVVANTANGEVLEGDVRLKIKEIG